MCHCALSNNLIQEAKAVTSDPKSVKINSLFMRDMDSCVDMVKGLSLCLDSHVNLLEQTIALYPV